MNMLKTMIFALLFITPVSVAASDFDGSKTLLCAVIQVFECQANGECEQVTVEEINFLQFLKIDFKNKKITGTRESGEVVTSEIKNIESMGGMLILQGVELGRGWSMAITEATGKMVMTASSDQEGFVVFGACIPD